MITAAEFRQLLDQLGDIGADDVAWSEAIVPPTDPDAFALELAFVICNSGMKNTVARRIYERVAAALREGRPALTVFGHRGKAVAISYIWLRREALLASFLGTPGPDRVEWLGRLPWIGGITKYHAAKNFGVDCVKPDVHLQRLADHHGVTPTALCAAIAAETGYRIATVDTVLWRACANGVIDSRRLAARWPADQVRQAMDAGERDGDG